MYNIVLEHDGIEDFLIEMKDTTGDKMADKAKITQYEIGDGSSSGALTPGGASTGSVKTSFEKNIAQAHRLLQQTLSQKNLRTSKFQPSPSKL